jgi:hypothetical protein
VNRETAALAKDEDDYGQAYVTIHHGLFIFMIVH